MVADPTTCLAALLAAVRQVRAVGFNAGLAVERMLGSLIRVKVGFSLFEDQPNLIADHISGCISSTPGFSERVPWEIQDFCTRIQRDKPQSF